jgi:hemerythrin-like domain-containing protein
MAMNWEAWNTLRNQAGTYAKMKIAQQCLRDVTRSFEDYNNSMQHDARNALNEVITLVEGYIKQCEARKLVEENKKGQKSE